MTEIVELDYDSTPERQAISNFMIAGEGPMDFHGSFESAGVFETAGLLWQQETVIGSMLTYGISKDKNDRNYTYDPTFNPIKMWHVNQDEFGDITPFIRRGMFNDVVSEQQFLDRRERLLDEQERRQRIANGSGLGMVLGMGLSLVDIATLVPIGGWITKGKTLAKVGKFAVAGSALTTAQEAVLHLQQDLRTVEESALAIGLAAPIGGGFGIFHSALTPGHILRPDHPNNIFHRNNKIRMGIAEWGKPISESAVVQTAAKGSSKAFNIVRDSSVGAATVKTGKVIKAGVVEKPLKLLNKATPVGRMLYATSGKVREIGQKLFDTGGILTDTMAGGHTVRSVEDYKSHYMGDFENVFVSTMDRYYELRMDLEKITGGIESHAAQAVGDKIREGRRFFEEFYHKARGQTMDSTAGGKHFEQFEFQDITYKILHDDLDNTTIGNLESRFGKEGAEKVVKASQDQANLIHEVNQRMEDLMVAAGMISDRQRMGKKYGVAQLWNPKAMRGENRQAAINFFMEKFLGKPSDEFLEEAYDMTAEQFAKLGREEVKIGDEVFTIERGADQRQEILEEWSGDSFEKQVVQAEIDLKVAEAALDAARKEAVWSSRDLRKSETEYRKASVAEAKKILERRVVERDRAAAEREKLQLERQALDTEVRRLEAEQEARMNQFHETGKWVRKYTSERTEDVEGAEGLLSHLEGETGGAPHADIQEARMWLTEADNELARVGDDALDAAVADAATKPVYSRVLAKLRERQAQITRQTNKIERRLERLNPKISKTAEAVEAASAAVLRVREGRVRLRAARKEANKVVKAERKGVKKAKKALKRQQGKLPVHMYVEDLVDKLGKQNKIPRGILESEVFASGRTKDRQIHLTNEERRQAIEMGLLRNDLYGIMHSAHDDIATRLALRQVFGTEDVNDVIRGVRDDYNSMIANARTRKDLKNPDKYIKRLTKERDSMEETIRGSWERTLGHHLLPDEPEAWAHWGLQKLRAWNFIKYGTGFLISSLTDPASVALTSGFHALSMSNMKAVRRSMKGMGSDEIRRLAIISERVLHNSRTLKIADVSDVASMSGIGHYGGIKHGLTSAADRIIQGLSDTASVASGMIWWNTRLKALGMMEMQHNLVDLMHRYDDLLARASAGDRRAKLEISKLASVGIGQEQAARIQQMLAKHKPNKVDGVNELEMSRWLDEGELGHAAYSDVEFALRRVANRAVMTPGTGETPLFMSKNFWKSVMQFQTYGFVILNRFITPALQRGISYRDMDAVLSMGLAAMLGTVVIGTKDLLRTGEIKERNAGEWAYDILDRSGYLMYLTVPASGAFTFANVALGLQSAPSRYANQSNQMAVMFGPSGNTLTDLWNVGQGAAFGDTDQIAKHGSKLLPFQILKQVGDLVVDN